MIEIIMALGFLCVCLLALALTNTYRLVELDRKYKTTDWDNYKQVNELAGLVCDLQAEVKELKSKNSSQGLGPDWNV